MAPAAPRTAMTCIALFNTSAHGANLGKFANLRPNFRIRHPGSPEVATCDQNGSPRRSGSGPKPRGARKRLGIANRGVWGAPGLHSPREARGGVGPDHIFFCMEGHQIIPCSFLYLHKPKYTLNYASFAW